MSKGLLMKLLSLPMMAPFLLLTGFALPITVIANSAAVAPSENGDSAKTLHKISVTATKSPRDVSGITTAVDVVEAETLETNLAHDLKDSLRYLPGVSVRNNAGRFGLSSINIRGLEGNRVLMEVDGVRIADAFSIGSFSNANRNFVDIDTLKSIEIVRGSASSLYGSNAIGGVVSFLTKDPQDYLQGHEIYVGGKTGYFSANEESMFGGTVAVGNDIFSVLLNANARRGYETETRGNNNSATSARTQANPQDIDSLAGLSKFVWSPTLGQQLKLTVDTDNGNTDTESYSGRTVTASGPSTVRVLDLDGKDTQDRWRAQIDYSLEKSFLEKVTPLIDFAILRIYQQNSSTEQKTFEARQTQSPTTLTPAERFRKFTFEQNMQGAELTLVSTLNTPSPSQRLTYGIEWDMADIDQKRDGYTRNPNTGVTSNTVTPDTFPVRDFPLSTTTETGLYVQDEIDLLDGNLHLVPGVRYDRFKLSSKADAIFSVDNPGVAVTNSDDDHVSPRFGVLYKLTPALAVVGEWSTGFRAPPYADANIGFTNLAFGYTAIPNPDLKPETSNNFELGSRGQHPWGTWEITAFHNTYDDFIDSQHQVGQPPQTPLIVFQSVNLKNATIDGAELRSTLDLEHLVGLTGFGTNIALGYARGEDDSTHEPLNSIDPTKLVVGLSWDAPSQMWGLEFVTTAVERKKSVDDSAGAQLRSPGYTNIDMLAHATIGNHVTLRGGIFNLTDKKYWEWSDLRGIAASSTVGDRYTRPGRNIGVTLSLNF